jgi:two-component system response regulator (stage 0 sporulation protein F)
MSTHPRVLIVDDEASLRRQLMVGLVQNGYEVDECEEGLSALTKIKAAESKQNPFCCVILDVRLPDIDGLKILSVIKAAYADLPVVVITGYGNEEMVNTVQSHGASVYLDKPFEMGTLVSVIEGIGPKAQDKPGAEAGAGEGILQSALVFVHAAKDSDPGEIYSRLCFADGVCYCDPVLGEWDMVMLLQAQNRKSIEQLVQRHLGGAGDVGAFEVHYCEKPLISKELEEFIQDYEKVQAMERGNEQTMDGRNLRKLTSYAVLDVDATKLASLYMKLYFTDNVVHCDVTDGGKQIILLLQGVSAQEIQSTIRSEIRMIPGVLRIKQLSALNFSTK